MSKPEKREEARRLRKEGWQLTDVAKELDISYGTVRHWCRDIVLTNAQLDIIADENPKRAAQQRGAEKLKQAALEQRLEYQQAGRELTRTGSMLHLMGCMLYWGEGTKHRQQLRFTNTDPYMLKLFIEFLRLELNIPNQKIGLRVLTHSENPDEWLHIQAYWIRFLELPDDTKFGIQHKVGTASRKKRYPNGICTIDVFSTEMVQKIFGAIQAYIGFENPKWVE
jgi:hypothetical protein